MRGLFNILGYLLQIDEPARKVQPDFRSLLLFTAKRLETLGFGLICSLLGVGSMFVSIENAKANTNYPDGAKGTEGTDDANGKSTMSSKVVEAAAKPEADADTDASADVVAEVEVTVEAQAQAAKDFGVQHSTDIGSEHQGIAYNVTHHDGNDDEAEMLDALNNRDTMRLGLGLESAAYALSVEEENMKNERCIRQQRQAWYTRAALVFSKQRSHTIALTAIATKCILPHESASVSSLSSSGSTTSSKVAETLSVEEDIKKHQPVIQQQRQAWYTRAALLFKASSNPYECGTLTSASTPVFLSPAAENGDSSESTGSMNAEGKLRRRVRIRAGVQVVRHQRVRPAETQLQTEWSENTLDGVAGEFDPLEPQSDDESEPLWVPSTEEQAKAALRHGFQVKNYDDGCDMDEEELLAAISARRWHDTAAQEHSGETTSVGFLHISKLSQVAIRLQEEEGSPRCFRRGPPDETPLGA
jgi:hypothetical protein